MHSDYNSTVYNVLNFCVFTADLISLFCAQAVFIYLFFCHHRHCHWPSSFQGLVVLWMIVQQWTLVFISSNNWCSGRSVHDVMLIQDVFGLPLVCEPGIVPLNYMYFFFQTITLLSQNVAKVWQFSLLHCSKQTAVQPCCFQNPFICPFGHPWYPKNLVLSQALHLLELWNFIIPQCCTEVHGWWSWVCLGGWLGDCLFSKRYLRTEKA